MEKEKTMKSLVWRSLRTSLTCVLSVSLTLIATVVDSAGQAVPNRARVPRLRPQQGTSQPRQAPQGPSSFPTSSPLFPTANDPDLSPFRTAYSAVYDPGSNTMIVYGGFDPTLTPQGDVLLQTNANGSGGAFAGTWSELALNFYPPPRTAHSAVYAQTNNRMIVLGGCADSFLCVPLNDTRVLTNANGSGGKPA